MVVKDIMVEKVVTVKPNTNVVSAGKLVGLMTPTDVVRVNHVEHLLIKIIKQLRKNGWVLRSR